MISNELNLKKPVYSWYAVYTKVNQEKKLAENLKDKNIEYYLPLKKTLRKWSDRKKWIEEPLFRCYLFVRVSYIEYFGVLHMPGVVNYVCFGGIPQSIPECQIESVKTIAQQHDREIDVNYQNVKKGTVTEILAGPLKGLKGEVVRLCGQYRLMIRMITMGCSLFVNISKDEIKLHPAKKPLSKNLTSRHYRTLQNTPYRKNGMLV